MHFELSADGGNTWTSTPSEEVTAAAGVEADITDLLPNQDYLARVVASNDLVSHATEIRWPSARRKSPRRRWPATQPT